MNNCLARMDRNNDSSCIQGVRSRIEEKDDGLNQKDSVNDVGGRKTKNLNGVVVSKKQIP
jgi:hypothetical protein